MANPHERTSDERASDERTSDALLETARTMELRGLVSGTAGNLSARLDDSRVLVTPTAVPYPTMTRDDLVTVNLSGVVLAGHRPPTSELALHLECLRAHPEMGAVVHTHAPYSSMFAVSGRPIPAAIDEFLIHIGGDVEVAPYQPTGTAALATQVADHLTDRSAVLMANHGLVTIGHTIDGALHATQVVEHNARIMWGAHLLGGVEPIPHAARESFVAQYRTRRGRV